MAQTPLGPLAGRSAVVYVAIRQRQDDGTAWANLTSLGFSPHECEAKVAQIDQAIPVWAAAHPMIRIARAILTVQDDA